jgi:transposase
MQIAVVATARKLAVLCWHLAIKDEDYTFARPSLTEKKLRALELRAGMPSHRGKKRSAAAHNLKRSPGASASSPSRPSAHTGSWSQT